MVTTIKIHEKTKFELDKLKAERESYDLIISKLVSKIKKDNLKTRLKQAYISYNDDQIKEFEEWEHTNL